LLIESNADANAQCNWCGSCARQAALRTCNFFATFWPSLFLSLHSGMTPLMWGATDLTRVDTFELLIAAKADLNLRDRCHSIVRVFYYLIKPWCCIPHISLGKTVLGTAIHYHKNHLVDFLRSIGALVWRRNLLLLRNFPHLSTSEI
jgi:hypothetical protein